mmetsp:Transcript_18593/g.20754  ORF Transcript_18593/g.20754 Transcript_18593/m.20754 type:complete len:102 (+) Transcript_18593:3-308(+)
MEKLYEYSAKELYRGILKMVRIYPSRNRELFRSAIVEEVQKYKTITDETETRKNLKRMRMMWAHLYMYKTKVEEINSDSPYISKPFEHPSINVKDDDFIYF